MAIAKRHGWWAALALSFACAFGSGGCESDARHLLTRASDPSDEAFRDDHVLEVEVELADADWAILRQQGRTLDVLCDRVSPYDYFVGAVVVDGVRYEGVEIRKKGFFGSLSDARPSLKLRFPEDALGPFGLRRMTLNNDQQDPSHLRQCLAYGVMERAGVPAPRCNHARVTVNGEALGVYTHVDSIKKPFLRLYFDDEDGSLYEGQVGDFTDEHLAFIESKTEELPGRDALEALRDALDDPDDARMGERVSALVDLPAFARYWATEALIGAWDGYSNNRNNWYAYRDPDRGRLYFIPWGPDATFSPLRFQQGLGTVGGPLRSVFATGRLASRLYATPEGHALYEETLRELLETAWDEAQLHAEIARMEALLGDAVDPIHAATVRAYVDSVRGDVEAELEGGLPPLPVAEVTAPECLHVAATLSGTFDTTYGNLESALFGGLRGTLTADADPPLDDLPTEYDAVAGFDEEQQIETIRIVGLRPSRTVLAVALLIPRTSFTSGTDVEMNGLGRFGAVVEVSPASSAAPRFLGFVTDGTVHLEAAGTADGDPVVGSFEGIFYARE